MSEFKYTVHTFCDEETRSILASHEVQGGLLPAVSTAMAVSCRDRVKIPSGSGICDRAPALGTGSYSTRRAEPQWCGVLPRWDGCVRAETHRVKTRDDRVPTPAPACNGKRAPSDETSIGAGEVGSVAGAVQQGLAVHVRKWRPRRGGGGTGDDHTSEEDREPLG